MRGREEAEGGISHPSTPPDRDELRSKFMRGKRAVVLAAAGHLSPPLKKTKLHHGRKQPLFATELDIEWQKVYDDLVSKIMTAGVGIEALQQMLEIERGERAAQGEEEEKKADGL